MFDAPVLLLGESDGGSNAGASGAGSATQFVSQTAAPGVEYAAAPALPQTGVITSGRSSVSTTGAHGTSSTTSSQGSATTTAGQGSATTVPSEGSGGPGVAKQTQPATPTITAVAPSTQSSSGSASGGGTTQLSTYVLADGVALPLPRQYIVNGSVDQGVDYSAPGGTPEYAMGSGVIIGEGISGFGPSAPILKITSGPLAGLEVYYGHAGPDLVRVGQHVSAGEQITEVGYGIVGISTGPHLEIGFYPTGPMGSGSRMLSVINSLLRQHPTGRAWGTGATIHAAVDVSARRRTRRRRTASSGGVAPVAAAATAQQPPVVPPTAVVAQPTQPATPAAATTTTPASTTTSGSTATSVPPAPAASAPTGASPAAAGAPAPARRWRLRRQRPCQRPQRPRRRLRRRPL